MAHQVRHNEEQKRFEIEIPNGPAMAAYERDGDVITFTHTVVPEEAEGKGMASAIVRNALDFARAEKLKVVPQCAFVSAYIKRHPEFEDLVRS